MKIFIAVPTFESIYPDTFKAIYGLDRAGHWVVFDFIRGYDCATARNNIVKQALNEKADYVFMIDNDVTVPGDAIVNFLDDPKDVCLGYYAHRDYDNVYRGRTCACKLFDENGERHFNYPASSEYTAQEMKELREAGTVKMEVHGGGMGCAFIKTDVFKRISFPWYKWITYPTGGTLSEDLYFCEQCKNAKIPIYVDTRVSCGHMLRHVQEVV